MVGFTANADKESWYSYWGLGFSNTTYPEPLESLLNLAESAPGTDRLQLDLDILGFYFPVGSGSTIAGFVINGAADRIFDDTDNIQLNLYTYGASVMTFLGNEPGDGLFFRGDFGITKAVVSSSFSNSVGSDTGTGFLIGTGYGFAVTPQHRILLNLNYANRTIESESYKTVALTVGILF
jgi:uncharacterized membrane protein (Fun14 family)